MSKCSNKYNIGKIHCEKCCGSDEELGDCSDYCITKRKCETCENLLCWECDQRDPMYNGYFCDCCLSGQCEDCLKENDMFIACYSCNTDNCEQFACLKCKKEQTCTWCEEVFCDNYLKVFSYETNEKICHDCILGTYKEGYGNKNNQKINFIFKRYLSQHINVIPDIIQIIINYYGKIPNYQIM